MTRVNFGREVASAERDVLVPLGVADAGLADELRVAGFTGSTVNLVHAAPLVSVAWADGVVSDEERRRIREAADDDGATATRASTALLDRWLTERPADQVLRASMNAVLAWLWHLAPSERLAAGRRLLERCQAVARASGDRFGTISSAEHEVIDRIAALVATVRIAQPV
jgi:uncharacterized tellurite resistance protein B-like protein